MEGVSARLFGQCGAQWRDYVCDLNEEHIGKHRQSSMGIGWPRAYDRLRARYTDPESSHRAASRDFDIQGGATTLAGRIMLVTDAEWISCRRMVELVFGAGPYTYEEAVSLNKTQTVALALHREGLLDRRELEGREIEYRRRSNAIN